MIRDEFNQIEVTNDKQLLRSEFGKTQKVEFSSQNENKLPEGDLNEKYIGKTIKKVTEVNVDYVNKVQTHATQTVVSSATTATSAASAVAATAVAASTVAVVAIATVTGISVALHDYHCELTNLFITSNSITYQMSIIDTKQEDTVNIEHYEENENQPRPRARFNDLAGDPDVEEDIPYDEGLSDTSRPFVLRVSNETYTSEHYLDYGLSGEGCFTGLTLGDSYEITLSENRYGGEVIYNESFVTYKNAMFRDFYISGEANFKMGTFGVYLDYLDETDALSDFTLVMEDAENEGLEFTFALDKVEGYQDVTIFDDQQLNADFSFERTYNYTFSYKKSGDVTEFSRGTVSFYNTSSMNSEVYGVNWDKSANFLNRTISFSLNFEDDYDIYSDFKFMLQLNGSSMQTEPIEFSLEKTTQEQTVSLMDFPDFDFSESYNYMFTYMEQGNDIEQIIDSGVVTMTDNSGAVSIVNGVNWDKKANFINKTFDLQLDYVDDFGYFDHFELLLEDSEIPEEINERFTLVKTTDTQTVTLNEDSNINLRRTYNYTFIYDNRGVTEIADSGTVTFTDNSGGKKEFRSITIDPVPNFVDNTFDVQLDYDDDFGELASFMLIMTAAGETTENYIYLNKTTKVQAISAKDDGYEIDFTKSYSYTFKYWDDAEGDYVTLVEDESLTFDLTDAVSIFNAFIFDETGNFQDETFTLRLDFVDQLNVFTSFTFTIEAVGKQYKQIIGLNHSTEPQVFKLNNEDTDPDQTASMQDDTFIYSFKYYDEREGADIEVITDSEFTFSPTTDGIFHDIETPYDFTPQESGASFLLPIKLDFDETSNVFTSFGVEIFKNDALLTSLMFEGETSQTNSTEWQYGILNTDGFTIQDIINTSNIRLDVIGYYNMEDYPNTPVSIMVYSEEDVNFTLGEKKEAIGGYVITQYINIYSTLDLSLILCGSVDDFQCQLLLESWWGNVYAYSLELGTMGYAYVNIGSPDSGPSFSEDNFESEFTEYPMKVSIQYRVRTGTAINGAAGGSDGWSEYRTLVLYDSYQFYLSV